MDNPVIFGQCADIKALNSYGITRVTIDISIEHHVEAVNHFWGKNLLISLAPKELEGTTYGLLSAAVDDQPSKLLDPPPPDTPPDIPSYARELFIAGYFNNPKLWECLEQAKMYTQRQHHNFIKTLPCVASKAGFWKYTLAETKRIPCGGDIVPHHVRDSSNAGTGMKPHDFYEVPACNDHHMQSIHADNSKVLREYLHKCAAKIRANEIKEVIKSELILESFGDITEEILNAFHDVIGFNS